MTKQKQPLVLVVDDEAPVRQVTAAMLRNGGFAVLTAADGEEALERARENKDELALLVTDLLMPQTDGLTLAHRVRQLCPKTRILLMSGYTDMLAQAKASRWPFLGKPFAKSALLDSVRAALSEGPAAESCTA